jgi:hypothetical protein
MNLTSFLKRSIHSLLNKSKVALQPLGTVQSGHSGLITRRAARALALTPRGGVPNDVLAIDNLTVSLHVEWFARDVHPWDRDLPETLQAELFAQQCLEDVDATIPRLFAQFPEMEVLEITVMKRVSKTRIIAGVVRRSDLASQVGSSLGMRLKTIGVNYRCADLRLEPIA